MSGEQAEERTARESMTKHTDSSRSTDSGVSGNAQTSAREIRISKAREWLRSVLEMDGYTSTATAEEREEVLLIECSRLASRVEELEKLMAKHSLSPEISSTPLDTGKEK